MVDPIRNQRPPSELTESDVAAALVRIEERSAVRRRDAGHVLETLTWGEGPAELTQHGLQDWLWYRLPTKYLTDEPGYVQQMAGVAAELFDELGLDWYAAICRSAATAQVHHAFDHSDEDGYSAMREAMEGSGIRPPDLSDFQWGDVMGIEEANARSAVESALEQAIADGDLIVGARAWRSRQRAVTKRTIDADHPDQPGQSWRSAVTTERLVMWTDAASMRSEQIGRLRARVANRLLHPVGPPADLAVRLQPMTWFLELFGPEQPLTAAGYLNRAFVIRCHDEQPWEDRFSKGPLPRSETDAATVFRLRPLLELIGALRKSGKFLKRTAKGTKMITDPRVAWEALTRRTLINPWEQFAVETCGLLLIDADGPVAVADVTATVARLAAELGWRTGRDDGGTPPASHEVGWAVDDTMELLVLFGMLDESGDRRDRRWALTPAGTALMLALLREDAVGPRSRPW